MTVTHEELAAYADGELEGAEAARVLLAVAASPEMMRTVQRYRALRERIGAEFAPNPEQELPDRLAALLRAPEEQPRVDRQPEPRARLKVAAGQLPPEHPSEQHERAADDTSALSHRRWLILPVILVAAAVAAFLPGRDGQKQGVVAEKQVASASQPDQGIGSR